MTLYVRNDSHFVITANAVGAKRFELAANGNSGDRKVLPLAVAQLPAFQRIWAAGGKVTVSQNSNYSSPVTSIPAGEISGDQRKAAAQVDSVATTAAGIVTDFNALLAKLRAANLMS